MEMITNAVSGHKVRVVLSALVESFNMIHRDATPSNILTGCQTAGVSPLIPLELLSSPFAVEPQPEGINQSLNMETEINKMVLRSC
jgi:hypothetical protein